jgi:hypothetical protein
VAFVIQLLPCAGGGALADMDGLTPWRRAIRQAAVRRARETRQRFGSMRNWPRRPSGQLLVYQPRKSLPFRRWTSCNRQCGLSCRAGTGDRRPRSPRRRLHTSTQRWLRGRTMATATARSRSRSSEGCQNSKPGLLTAVEGLVASIHLLFVYFCGPRGREEIRAEGCHLYMAATAVGDNVPDYVDSEEGDFSSGNLARC